MPAPHGQRRLRLSPSPGRGGQQFHGSWALRRLRRTTFVEVEGLFAVTLRFGGEAGGPPFGPKRGPDGDHDRHDPADERERKAVIVAMRLGDPGLDWRV